MPTVKDNAKGKRKRAHIMTRINALRKKLHIPKRPKPGELPEIVAKNHKCYKASYTIATVLFMWMVTSLEHSWLYLPHVEGTPAEKDGDAFACMWLAAIAAWCAYFFVQGTDAGYVRKEEMEQEGRGLLAKGDGDGATPEGEFWSCCIGASAACAAGCRRRPDVRRAAAGCTRQT